MNIYDQNDFDWSSASELESQDNEEKIPFCLVVLDEARWLLQKSSETEGHSLFRELQASLAKLFKNYQIFFAVMVDTNSKVGNFTPSIRNDPSAKLKDSDYTEQQRQLFRFLTG